jgi:hypothetical protein
VERVTEAAAAPVAAPIAAPIAAPAYETEQASSKAPRAKLTTKPVVEAVAALGDKPAPARSAPGKSRK